ncbi:hypothetical protein [Inquilinus limosus]|uniref:Uncharacterized protein n=1 Tax=Inquilinus limosus MP06 TaxID=1398085 RepID=A0A0A0DBC1_9PROT|nr:hypothetical protein [Inquilinus limosus]KGM35310.1 hypothetical protein P409_05200 [Inquilinus limosus MP06]
MPRKRAPTTPEDLALWRDHGIRVRRLSPAEHAALYRAVPKPKPKPPAVALETVNARLRARPFEPHREPMALAACDLVAVVFALVEEHEQQLCLRRRARRPADAASFKATVTALVSDLAHQFLSDAGGTLAVPRSKRELGRKKDRYDAWFLGETFPRTLDLMKDAGLLVQHEGTWHYGTFGQQSFKTVIEPGPALIAALSRYPDLTAADFAIGEGKETIVLKWSNSHPNPRLRGRKVDYDDTPETVRMGEEMTTLNDWWAGADLSLSPGYTPEAPVNLSRRSMSRIFSADDPNFGRGGRLYHSFWLDMPSDDRAALLIAGEPVVSLDFSAAFLRMAYGRVSEPVPEEDLYAVGKLAQWPRSIVKPLVNAMLDDRTKMDDPAAVSGLRYWPKDVQSQLKEDWPDHPGLAVVRTVIEQEHAPIRPLFYRGIGMEFQALESRIVIAVLLTLRSMGIVGLPVHDCVIVPEKHEAVTKDLMMTEFRRVANAEAVVRRA